MSTLRRQPVLGVQAIPEFARRVCLVYNDGSFNAQDDPFPEADSQFNVACMVFWPRSRLLHPPNQSQPSDRVLPLGITYWAPRQISGINLIYGKDFVAIPGGAEYFSLAWLQPPIAYLAGGIPPGPFPEDFFRVKYRLST